MFKNVINYEAWYEFTCPENDKREIGTGLKLAELMERFPTHHFSQIIISETVFKQGSIDLTTLFNHTFCSC